MRAGARRPDGGGGAESSCASTPPRRAGEGVDGRSDSPFTVSSGHSFSRVIFSTADVHVNNIAMAHRVRNRQSSCLVEASGGQRHD